MSALPQWVDPRRLASARGSVEGEIALSALTRLAGDLYPGSEAGTAWLRLDFAEDGQRRITMMGRLQAQLQLRCQRCLGPADWAAQVSVHAMVVADDEAASVVPREWEPVIMDTHGLSPATLAEDELILALPPVARCNDHACREKFERQQTEAVRNDNPFAALAELKYKR